MLAQVTYISKFIMADSEDEFMPICVAASAAFIVNNRNICRPGVGRASAGRPAISDILDTAGQRRAGIGSTHDARPMPHDVPMQNRPAGRLIEFPP